MISSVVLAGGSGTRLYPLTLGVNKHLLPMGNGHVITNPMLLARSVSKRVLVVTSPESVGQLSGAIRHCCFACQRKPGGIAEAMMYAEDFCDSSQVFVVLGDNIFDEDGVSEIVDDVACRVGKTGAMVWTKRMADPGRYGVIDINQSGVPVGIEEKPRNPKSDFAVVGAYLFDSSVWKILPLLERSDRGELEITDVIRWYMERGSLVVRELGGKWLDIGGSVDDYWKATRTFRGTYEHSCYRR